LPRAHLVVLRYKRQNNTYLDIFIPISTILYNSEQNNTILYNYLLFTTFLHFSEDKTLKKALKDRKFPDIDAQLHCVAVKISDQLRVLYRKSPMETSDIKAISDLTNLLLLIRKQSPQLAAPKQRKSSSSAPINTPDDLINE
jgi:hypothetical protein